MLSSKIRCFSGVLRRAHSTVIKPPTPTRRTKRWVKQFRPGTDIFFGMANVRSPYLTQIKRHHLSNPAPLTLDALLDVKDISSKVPYLPEKRDKYTRNYYNTPMGPLSQASNALLTYTKHHIEDPRTSLSEPDTYSAHQRCQRLCRIGIDFFINQTDAHLYFIFDGLDVPNILNHRDPHAHSVTSEEVRKLNELLVNDDTIIRQRVTALLKCETVPFDQWSSWFQHTGDNYRDMYLRELYMSNIDSNITKCKDIMFMTRVRHCLDREHIKDAIQHSGSIQNPLKQSDAFLMIAETLPSLSDQQSFFWETVDPFIQDLDQKRRQQTNPHSSFLNQMDHITVDWYRHLTTLSMTKEAAHIKAFFRTEDLHEYAKRLQVLDTFDQLV